MIQKAIQYPELIQYLKGFSNYTWLHYCDGKKVLVAKSLCYFERRLPDFFRIHKTALVNPRYILDFQAPPRHKMSGSIRLKDGTTLPVSRRRWNQIIIPMTTALMKTSSAFQSENNDIPSVLHPHAAESVEQVIPHPASRQIWVVMADEIKAGLLQQLISERWSSWSLQVFETGNGLQNALLSISHSETPAMILLDGSHANSLLTLRAIKRNTRFRYIPTLLLASAGNQDLAGQGYGLGANSVIVQPADLTRFSKSLDKTFRYWLSMVAAPFSTTGSRPVLV